MKHEVTEQLSVAGRGRVSASSVRSRFYGKRIETDRHGTEPRRRSGNIYHWNKGKDRRLAGLSKWNGLPLWSA